MKKFIVVVAVLIGIYLVLVYFQGANTLTKTAAGSVGGLIVDLQGNSGGRTPQYAAGGGAPSLHGNAVKG